MRVEFETLVVLREKQKDDSFDINKKSPIGFLGFLRKEKRRCIFALKSGFQHVEDDFESGIVVF